MKSIYDSHVRYLTAVCLRYIPSEDEAKDVLQDAFIKIFSSIGTFRGSDSALRAGGSGAGGHPAGCAATDDYAAPGRLQGNIQPVCFRAEEP